MKRIRNEDCLSDLSLDMLRVDELAPDAATHAREHLEACALCRARNQELTQDAAQAELPPLGAAVLPLRVQPSSSSSSSRTPWGRAAGFSLVAAAVVLIVIGRPGSTPSDSPVGEVDSKQELGATGKAGATAITRTKGAPTLMFHIKRDGVVREGGPQEILHPDDVIRFSYSWSEAGSVAVLSRDGAGVVSVYISADEQMVRTDAGEAALLPGAVSLDDVTGPETFYGVFCSQPVATAKLEQVIANQPNNPVIPGCKIDTVRVTKRDTF